MSMQRPDNSLLRVAQSEMDLHAEHRAISPETVRMQIMVSPVKDRPIAPDRDKVRELYKAVQMH